MNKEIAVYDNTVSARTYLSYIAEQAGGIAVIGRDGKLYIKTIGESSVTLPLKLFKTFKWGEKFKITREGMMMEYNYLKKEIQQAIQFISAKTICT